MDAPQLEAMSGSGQKLVVCTLKAYLKLCVKPDQRPLILKDQTNLLILKNFLEGGRVVVMRYLVKILLYLSGNADYPLVLSVAAEYFSPNMVY